MEKDQKNPFGIMPLQEADKKPFEGDFFSIEEYDDVKKIHINGSLWKSDDEWKHSEYVFLIVPLEEFIDNYSKQRNEYVDTLFQDAKTGIAELSEKEAEEMISHYFNGKYPDGMLGYADIHMDTPVGNYAIRWS